MVDVELFEDLLDEYGLPYKKGPGNSYTIEFGDIWLDVRGNNRWLAVKNDGVDSEAEYFDDEEDLVNYIRNAQMEDRELEMADHEKLWPNRYDESRKVRGRLVEEEEKLRYTDSELAKVALDELQNFKKLVVGKKYSVELAKELERICSGNVEINGGDWMYSSRWVGTEEWDGTDEGIEWIRVEKYENLEYIYIRTEGEDTIKESDISFDVVNEYWTGGEWEYEENAAPEFDGVDEEYLREVASSSWKFANGDE